MKLIKEDGYDFMFMNVYEFTRFQKEYKRLNKSEIKKLYYFLSKIKPVFHKNGMLLYKIK